MSSERQRKPVSVTEALSEFLEKSGLGDRIEQAAAAGDWAARVGDRIAQVAEPLGVRDGVLFVGVRSSAWLMELRMMEGEIRRRMNEGREKGRIEKIRFVMEEGPDRPDGGNVGDVPG